MSSAKLIILMLCISLSSYSQIIPKEAVRPLIARSSLLLVSGFADGLSEVLKIKYPRFEKRFPNASAQFWNYSISHTNKWSTYPHPKFPLSSTALVWTTDGYHLARMVRNCTMITAITIPINGGKKRKWYSYAIEGATYYICYTAGFNLAYDGLFK